MRQNEDLLATGVERFLRGARYVAARHGYARITHELKAQRLPPDLPPGLHRYVRRPGAKQAGRAGREARGSQASQPCAATRFDHLMFMDIESLGFIGRPLFLIGALHVHLPRDRQRAAEMQLIQYFARDYSEEGTILKAFGREATETELWVTYNGASFDLPFLELRATQFRLAPFEPKYHLDLLPATRRLWANELPDCKLKTVEHRICGRPRGEDIPGSRIPAAYHAYVRSGEPLDMIEVLKHNAADLTSLLELYLQIQTAMIET